MSVNTYIPTSFANGARYNTGGGADGLLPVITSGNYYTFNVSNNSAADNIMALLETTFNPITVSTVAQNPGTGVVNSTAPVTVTITTSAAPASGENVFLRYTTNGYTASTLVQFTFSGTTDSLVLLFAEICHAKSNSAALPKSSTVSIDIFFTLLRFITAKVRIFFRLTIPSKTMSFVVVTQPFLIQ